tara:strand:- start:117 stop:284 length:168 start_codon:yes stop_codon:yes gene_type:complete
MSRKHFEQIAKILIETKGKMEQQDFDDLVAKMSYFCAINSKSFNATTFINVINKS